MDRMPKPGEFYRDKENRLYQAVTAARLRGTGEELVIYQDLDGGFQIYAEPLNAFINGYSQAERPEKPTEELAAQGAEAEKAPVPEEPEKPEAPNPCFLEFLEADTYKGKLEALLKLKEKAGDKEVDSICEVLDLKGLEGSAKQKVEWIEKHLEMLEKYDGKRLR